MRIASALAALLLVGAGGQAKDTTRSPEPAAVAHPLTVADLEPFLDGLIPTELARNDIAGLVISVVKDGQVLLAKGYGYADVARRRPVSPDSTLFRIASISKLFNATAVMQLVEQGKLDLDRDVGDYLDFRLPRRWPDKITLRHLLTHTAGFEESFKDLPADSGKSVSLRDAVSKRTPGQIYRPGTVTSYSNYGADLAGYIVQRVSGVAFPEYIRQRILEPLGMRHSSIREPLPPELRRLVAEGYEVASEPAKPFEILQGEPSGNMSSTGADMARFAIAHLQLGRLGSERILSELGARTMATSQFRTHFAVNGMGLGFFEESRNGHRMIGHGGDLSYFHSQLSLLMDDGVGFFISVNSAGSGGLYGIRETVRDAFLDRYFPREMAVEPAVANSGVEARRVAGGYTLSRRGETGLSRVVGLAVDVGVRANADGTVQIPFLTGPAGKPIRWYPIGHGVFRTADGSERIGFVTERSGAVTRMAYVGGHELHRVGWVDGRGFNLGLIAGSTIVILGVLLGWPLAGLARRRYRQPVPDDGVGRRLRTLVRVVALLDVLFLAGIALFIALAFGEKIPRDSRSDPVLGVIRMVGFAGLLGIVAAIGAAVRSWAGGRNRLARFKYTAFAAATLAFGWFAIHWRLLALGFAY